MNFATVRDFRTSTRSVWDKLNESGEIVVTNNGKPIALMLNIADGEYGELSQAIRQAKAMLSINRMRTVAADSGYMSDEDIEAEIRAARQELNNSRV